jgi:4-alpha-glucanotransferase
VHSHLARYSRRPAHQDHNSGFFRIWEMPTESVEGLLCGHFVPRRPAPPRNRAPGLVQPRL